MSRPMVRRPSGSNKAATADERARHLIVQDVPDFGNLQHSHSSDPFVAMIARGVHERIGDMRKRTMAEIVKQRREPDYASVGFGKRSGLPSIGQTDQSVGDAACNLARPEAVLEFECRSAAPGKTSMVIAD